MATDDQKNDEKEKEDTPDGKMKENDKESSNKPPINASASVRFHTPLGGEVSFGNSWERRYQTLAQFSCSLYFIMPASFLTWVTTFYSLGHYALFGYSLGHNPIPVTLLALYLGFILVVDKSPMDGSRTPYLRRLTSWWNHSCDYLPLTLVKTADLPADNNNYVLGYHPHGIISVGCFGAFATDGARTLDLTQLDKKKDDKTDDKKKGNTTDTITDESTQQSPSEQPKRGFSSLFPGLDRRVITLPQNFGTPIIREYFLHMGALTSDKQTFRNVLAKPNTALIVVVGGAAESMNTEPGAIGDLVLGKRRGFVREAILGNASLVPVIAFGENDLYHIVDIGDRRWIPKLQAGVKKYFGFAMPLFTGRSILFQDFGVMPQRKPVVVVVGAPIPPPPEAAMNAKKFNPLIDRKTDEALNDDGALLKEHHAKYIKALEELHDEYKNAFWNAPGRDRRRSLTIVK